ncbi:SPASM domain peptide maturase of grasp-with-spasm system [Chryseobacterium bernardetii]|uniref:SPASM domain peptide maturase of grasp-with-spasm system n=2 Tax=Chryseobacterium TaxID=59732 RepID=A0A543E9W6_9FLAO|nr:MULTISPECIES: grasp-with-spasm system SPASM domain peptide maturase [Chryseobacterium]MDR6371879.1 SPASM domain peptide maturase of grasp-with-spasm system [Chryseobacterium vietnamense]MDR6443811.1 SPASM domain peptide maturase of grasp-with-spasm system [Chryseobacterium bernardetii]TQM18368.1 SPASM domain peptide maturase of grasp-with-spasm system [Chryseobacterium aquifrigidense]
MKYFNLFSAILITKGASRVLISDLQRNVSELYPLELYEIIVELKTNSIEAMMTSYDEESKEIVQNYINLLLEKEYGFITESDWDRNFPPLSYEYHEPSAITNLFIEMEDIGIIKKIYPSIENLGIRHLVIYSLKPLPLKDCIEIDEIFKTSVISGIEIFSPFHQEVNLSFIQALQQNTVRIYSLIFYNSPKPPFKAKDEYRFSLHFVKDDLKISACGKVELRYFNTNITKVIEAVNHNSCLYKKIGIDRNGDIKNCPLMSESFGNIHKHSLEDAVNQPDFKKYWNLTKDQIEICKDCEFRYVCTDCRAYTENALKDIKGINRSKPLKCGYNPYTAVWEDWSKNPLKQEIFNSLELR